MVLNGFIESLLEHYIHGNRYTENDSSLFPENLAVAESCGRISAFLRSEVQTRIKGLCEPKSLKFDLCESRSLSLAIPESSMSRRVITTMG